MKFKLLTFFIVLKILSFSQTCESQRYISEVFTDHTFDGAIQFGADDPYGILMNQNLYLDVYQPLNDTLSKRPVIVHQFGGGYLIGTRSEPNIPTFADKYTKRGFVFISVDYRIGFNVAETGSAERAVYRGIVDLKASLRYIVDHAADWRIDTNQIFLTGTSAGCISAMGQTYMDESDRPSATFGTFLEPTDLGCIDCTANNNHNNIEIDIQGIINNWGAVIDTSVINLNLDPKDNVPLISFHGTEDNAVFYTEGSPFSVPYFPNMQGSFLIHQRLKNIGVKNKLFPLEGFGHEPQLTNPQLTDTIVIYGSQFIYEIMQAEITPIQGDTTVCLNEESTYSVPFVDGSTYCWELTNGTIISLNQNSITVQWDTAGQQSLVVNERTNIEINKRRSIFVAVENLPEFNISHTSFDGLFNFSIIPIPTYSYHWEFGDNDFGNTAVVNHQYTDTGSYEVVLNANNDFCNINDTLTIISDICPIANFENLIVDSFVYITNNAQFYDLIYYSFGNENFSTEEISKIQYQEESIYTIQQIVSNSFCVDTFEVNIEIEFCPVSDFTFSVDGLQANFTNTSYNSIAQFWNFGDASTNALENPVHYFSTSGYYEVQLIVYAENLCTDTILKTIFVEEKDSAVSIINVNNPNSIYPNPSFGFVYFDFKNSSSIKIFDITGKNIPIEIVNNSINVSAFKKGIYFISLYIGKEKIIRKLIIN